MLAAKATALSLRWRPGAAIRIRRPSHIGPFWIRIIGSAVSQTVPGAERYLGPDAARARNRRSLSAARSAGRGGIGKDAGPSDFEGSGAAPGGWTRHNREY